MLIGRSSNRQSLEDIIISKTVTFIFVIGIDSPSNAWVYTIRKTRDYLRKEKVTKTYKHNRFTRIKKRNRVQNTSWTIWSKLNFDHEQRLDSLVLLARRTPTCVSAWGSNVDDDRHSSPKSSNWLRGAPPRGVEFETTNLNNWKI